MVRALLHRGGEPAPIVKSGVKSFLNELHNNLILSLDPIQGCAGACSLPQGTQSAWST